MRNIRISVFIVPQNGDFVKVSKIKEGKCCFKTPVRHIIRQAVTQRSARSEPRPELCILHGRRPDHDGTRAVQAEGCLPRSRQGLPYQPAHQGPGLLRAGHLQVTRSWNCVAVGCGHDALWWKTFFAALAEGDYHDPLSIEVEDPLMPNNLVVIQKSAVISE